MKTIAIQGLQGTCLVSSRRLLLRTRDGRARLRLERANLGRADLRGLDLTGADLRNADLRGVRLGVPRVWQFGLVLSAVAAAIAIGIGTGLAGSFLHRLIASDEPIRRALGVLMAAELVVFLVAAIWKGPWFASRQVLPPILALAVAASAIGLFTGGTGVGGLALLVFSVVVGALLCLAVLSRTVAASAAHVLFTVVALAGALAARSVGGGLAAVAIAVAALLVGRRALSDDRLAPRLVQLTRAIACARGTSFVGADLRGARFSGRSARCCDFRGAQLEGSTFEGGEPELCRFDPSSAASASLTG